MTIIDLDHVRQLTRSSTLKHKGERKPSSYFHGPAVQGGTTHASSRRKTWRCRALRYQSALQQGAGIDLRITPNWISRWQRLWVEFVENNHHPDVFREKVNL